MKLSAAIPFAAALMFSTASAFAVPTVITFDDLPSSDVTPISTYAGLSWENFYVIKGTDYGVGTGYDHGTVSSPNIAFNGFAHPASFSSATAFTLLSIEVTKAWNYGYTHFDGYVGSTLTYSLDVLSSIAAPTSVTFNWANLNKVVMSDGNGSYQTAIDNLTISAVPEPGAYGMLLVGLGLVGAVARRRAKQA
jgi:hypothetical protein